MGGSLAPPCKILTVVIGDNEQSAVRDIEASLNARIPVVVVRGTELTDRICDTLDARRADEAPRHQPDGPVWGAPESKVLLRLMHSGKAVATSDNSEEVASTVHFEDGGRDEDSLAIGVTFLNNHCLMNDVKLPNRR